MIGGPTPGAIAIKDLGGFDITDAAPLPDGGIVLLERRFRYSEGIKMRIRRIAAKELKPGALITGEILLEARDALNIDNMEAISAHRSKSGETILTLMSDDNFSPLQRTLLMQFALWLRARRRWPRLASADAAAFRPVRQPPAPWQARA